jgi:hypothetical protein
LKIFLGWGAFAEACEYLLPDIELAIEKETGESIPVSFELSDKKLVAQFPDEYLYALKRFAAHIQIKGKIPEKSFIESSNEEDEELIHYYDSYKKGYKFPHLVFFSETLGVYLPIKNLKEPIHFEHEDRKIEMCSIGSLYELERELQELKKLLNKPYEGKFQEEAPWHVEIETLNQLLELVELAIKENKPLVFMGED